MKKNLLFTLLILSLSLSADYRQNVRIPSVTFQLKVDQGFPAVQRNCQWCHSFGYILNQGTQTKAYWKKIVVRMRDTFKAPITKEDERLVTEYLYRNYGK